MKACIAVDLDQTLIYSERSAGRAKSDTDVWVEDHDGKPLSFMTARAHHLLAELTHRHHVVPVTTRTPTQYARVRLPGRYPYAVCANGGVLLVHGERDTAWDARIRHDMARTVPASTIHARLAQVQHGSWVRSIRQVEDLFVYLVATHRSAIPSAWLTELQGWVSAHGWVVSQQGRKVYVVPGPLLCKGDAALRIALQVGGPLLSAGDSLLDSNLLDRAMVAIRPAHGELDLLNDQTSHARVTSSSGPEAAEEILTYLGDVADGLVQRLGMPAGGCA